VGGLAPDIDQSTAELWGRVRGGNILGKLLSPLFGGHRFISHSILGIFLFGFGLKWLLAAMSSVLIVDMDIVWWSFMIGFVAHLIMDTFTRDGVPWLFPIPLRFGIPPFKALRLKTGGLLEKSFVFPGLIIANIYIFYTHYYKFLDLLRNYIK
jgi:inner membrane protein